MAAILTDHLLSPRAGFPAADVFPNRRVIRRNPIGLSETLRGSWSVTCQELLLIWMLAVVAISSLMAAGAMGFLD